MGCGSSNETAKDAPHGGPPVKPAQPKSNKYSSDDAAASDAASTNNPKSSTSSPCAVFTLCLPGDHSIPSARKMHAAVAIGDHSILIFGGVTKKGDAELEATANFDATATKSHLVICHQTFRVSLEGHVWHHLANHGEVPASRATHTMTLYSGAAYVFGSHAKTDATMFMFNVAFNQWKKIDDDPHTPTHPHDAGLPLNISGGPYDSKPGSGANSGNSAGGAPTTGGGGSSSSSSGGGGMGDKPRCLSGHTAVVVLKSMVVFGGESDYGFDIKVHIFHFEERRWAMSIDAKGPLITTKKKKDILMRRDHSSVIFRDCMYVFGGFGIESEKNELISFDITTREWDTVATTGKNPPIRGGHVCSIFQEFMFIFGGLRHKEYLNDLYVLDLGNLVWTSVVILANPSAGPSPKSSHPASPVGSPKGGSLVPAKGGAPSSADAPPLTQSHWVPQPRAFAAATTIGPGGKLWYIHGGTDEHKIFSDLCVVNLATIAKSINASVSAAGSGAALFAPSPAWDTA